MKTTIAFSGTEKEIEATRRGDTIHVVVDGATVEFTIVHQNGVQTVLQHGNRLIHLAGFAKGDDRTLSIDGQIVSYKRVVAGGASAETDQNSLSASIPALVTELLVAVGDAVTAGQKLILLESMKMVIPISASTAGTVRAIHCAAGDAVQPGIVLIEIENENENE